MTVTRRLYGAQLIAEERFRILNEEGDGKGLTTEYLLSATVDRLQQILAVLDAETDAVITMLVRSGAHLALAIDRLMAMHHASPEYKAEADAALSRAFDVDLLPEEERDRT